ncbi:hypothetical protein CBL_07494 [Carabus blaptoides fortunei]
MNYRDNIFIPSVKPDLKPNRDRQPSNGTDKSARKHIPYSNRGAAPCLTSFLFPYFFSTMMVHRPSRNKPSSLIVKSVGWGVNSCNIPTVLCQITLYLTEFKTKTARYPTISSYYP